MQLISLSPLAASALLWRTANGPCVTVAVKATFQLAPDGVAALAAPLPLFHDVFHEQNVGRSLHVASDAVPHKPRADVLLSGSAYAPPGQRVSHRWVRLAVFDAAGQAPAIDKRLQIVGERQRDPASGQATAPAPFARLPVRYELAFGGARCPDNPVGRGADPGDLRLPSIVDPGAPDAPAGFGPIASAWPERRRALGAWDPAKLLLPVPELPIAMDWGYFNAAPRDQQIPYLRGDEWILLEGLHPTAAQVRSRLPGLGARVLLRAPRLADPAGVELTVRCDTLWIDADALRCTLTWRASLAVAERALEAVERGTILVTLAPLGERVAWPAPRPAAAPAPPVGATTAPLPEGVRPPAGARPSLPIPEPDPSVARGMSAEEWAARGAGGEPARPSLDLTQTRPLDPAAFAEALKAFDPAPPVALPGAVVAEPSEAAPGAAGAAGAAEATGAIGAPGAAHEPGAAGTPGAAGAPAPPASQVPAQPPVLANTREFNLQDVLRGARHDDAPFPLAPPQPAEQAAAAKAPAEVSLEALRKAFPAMAAHIAAHAGAPLPTSTLPLPEPEPSKPTSEDLAGSPDLPPPARTTENVPILNLTPFAAFSIPWQARPPRDSLTVVIKGTFDIVPDAPAAIAADQELPGGDVHVDDDPQKSLRYPSDFAIFKPKADVLLVGHAHRAGAGDATALVRLRLGDALDRSVAAIGPRRWDALGVPTAPEPWDRIPLRFENAFGGAGFGPNPVGTGLGARAGGALPSLELPDRLIRSTGDRPAPACFAPVAATWGERLKKIGSYGERWRRTRWPFFPDDFDWTFFNAAPPEQQIAYPQGDEAFELWSVRPEGEVVRGRLPGLRVRVFKQATEKAGGGFSEVPMRLDTVWFDADALRLVLVWRGLLDVADEDASEIASLFVLSEPMVKGEQPMTKRDARARFFAELAALEAAEEPAAGEEGAANDTTAEEEGASALEARIAEALAQARARRRTAAASGAAAAGTAAAASAAPGAAEAAAPSQGEGDAPSHDAPPHDAPPHEAAPGDPVAAPPPAGRDAVLELLRLGEPLAGVDLTGIDLSGADLAGADLGGVLLKRANLRGARLDGARLVEAVLAEADAEGARFEGADLTRADLTGANVKAARFAGAVLELAAVGAARCEGAVFEGARAPGASFAGATLTRARFDRADLTGAEMMQAALDEASFRDATLDDVKIYGATGTRVALDGASIADLRADDVVFRSGSFRRARGAGSVWEGADLTEGVFAGAALPEASFTRATLDRATFDAADLVDARFRKARLRGARLRQANLMRAAFDSADLEGADLRGANLYQAETWKARTAESLLADAFTAGTKLEER
ncbi:DUF2169 domain-containing protein [Sorangium sp. So ce513]|uniref:DUF2169 family type VI secretion system accessory protein n=1 Tax=Sorangium sp. So ce513 TaxID=3133315 RepID=UPI003F603A4D